MPEHDNKKLVPFPVLLIIICAVLLAVFFILNPTRFSPQEKSILEDTIIFLFAVVVFYFIFKPFHRHREKRTGQSKDAADEKIPAEEDFVGVSLSGRKIPPPGYVRKIAGNEQFSFCYPEEWQLLAPSDASLYAEVKQDRPIPGTAFHRNFNISCQNISKLKDTDLLFQAIIDGVMNILRNSHLEYKTAVEKNGFLGMRYKINYEGTDDLKLSCYQVALTTAKKRYLLIYTFTTVTSDFENSIALFEEIVDTASIFD